MYCRAEADAAFFRALADDFFQAGKCAAADKEDVGGVYLDEILIRMLAPALRGNAGHRAFNQFQQCLLYAFAGDVAGNRRVVAFARDFVDFVDIDDAALGFFDIEIAFAQKFGDDLLDVFADITCFGQRGCIGHHERYVEFARQRLRQQGFARTGGADEQDVGFGQLHRAARFRMAQAFVVVVNGNGQGFFRLLLADNVVVQVGDDFGRGGQFAVPVGGGTFAFGGRVVPAFQHDAAGFHAFVADIGVFAFNQMFDFLFGFTAKRAVAVFCGHRVCLCLNRPQGRLKKRRL